jgi:hypothetical protein
MKAKKTVKLQPNVLKFMPDAELDVCEENLRTFWYWIYERHSIYCRRFIKKLPAPWSKDSILRDNKFTNAYRELDRNSQYLINTVIRNEELSTKNKIFGCIIFRFFNRTETYDKIEPLCRLKNTDLNKIVEVCMKIEKPFCNAYQFIPSPVTMYIGKSLGFYPKGDNFKKEVLKLFVRSFQFIKENQIVKRILESEKPKELIDVLKKVPFLYDFITYELYCDFDYFSPEIVGFNQNDFVNVGPGAVTGVRWIFPNRGNYEDAKEVIYHLRDEQESYLKLFGFEDFPYLQNKYKRLTLREIEHSLCEFQKYMKMKFKVGKQRQKFTPKTQVV